MKSRVSKKNTLLSLAFFITAIAILSLVSVERQQAWLYPEVLTERNQRTITEFLESKEIDVQVHEHRVFVDLLQRPEAQVLIIQGNLALEAPSSEISGCLCHRKEPSEENRFTTEDLEDTLGMLPEIDDVKLAIPDLTYFKDSDRPTVLSILSNSELKQTTREGIEFFLRMHGCVANDRLEFQYR